MPSYYVYLLSSLPVLSFGVKPPFSFDRLISSCEALIPEEDIEMLKAVVMPEGAHCAAIKNQTFAKWRSFDTMLRNELVQIRASRKKEDPAKYIRQDGCPASSYAAHLAINAYRKPSIIESEKTLDLDRWKELDELAIGHYFDLDALIVYALKLLIIEKWEKIRAADNKRLLEEVLAHTSPVQAG
jgi:hypothetical protein